MVASRQPTATHGNRLLGLPPTKDYRRLDRHLERIPFGYRQSLYWARRPLGFVYFIETGVGSLVNTMANGDAPRSAPSATRAWSAWRCRWAMIARPPEVQPRKARSGRV